MRFQEYLIMNEATNLDKKVEIIKRELEFAAREVETLAKKQVLIKSLDTMLVYNRNHEFLNKTDVFNEYKNKYSKLLFALFIYTI